MTRLPSSEALFGSLSRGDHDALSDRDILLVDNDIRALRERERVLKADGYSVASYTYGKLDALSANGALFIQHLKEEAQIIRDESGRLSKTLSEFRPKTDYSEELRQNAILAQLARVYPKTSKGALWSADVFYVATRNFGILYLAQRGVYKFGYRSVLQGLLERRVIAEDAISELTQLRRAKTIYRSGELIPLNAATEIVDRAAATRPDPSFPGRAVGITPDDALHRSQVLSDRVPAYLRLRNLERAYIALAALVPSEAVLQQFATLIRWIENPRAYTVIAGTLEPQLIMDLHRARLGRFPLVTSSYTLPTLTGLTLARSDFAEACRSGSRSRPCCAV